jgi:GTPase SAR1 family protein
MRGYDFQADGLDPEEPVLAIERGIHAVPWHPADMKSPYIYKLCLIGPCGAGKSSIAHRLVAHTFDPACKPTRAPSQLFWRHFEKVTGRDIMVELEDTPGVQAHTTESGELTPAGLVELDQLLKPLVWFERRRRDRLGKAVIAEADETQPLVSSAKGGKKVQRENGGLSGMRKSMGAFAGSVAYMTADAFGSGPQRPNPIGEDRKRLGFLIVADLGSRSSFDTAHAIVDRIFARLQFDTNDPMTCPVAVIIVGNKSDLRGRHREMEEEEALRKEILHRYENRHASPPHNVLYVECSAQTNSGLDAVSERCLPNGQSLEPCKTTCSHVSDRGSPWHVHVAGDARVTRAHPFLAYPPSDTHGSPARDRAVGAVVPRYLQRVSDLLRHRGILQVRLERDHKTPHQDPRAVHHPLRVRATHKSMALHQSPVDSLHGLSLAVRLVPALRAATKKGIKR